MVPGKLYRVESVFNNPRKDYDVVMFMEEFKETKDSIFTICKVLYRDKVITLSSVMNRFCEIENDLYSAKFS